MGLRLEKWNAFARHFRSTWETQRGTMDKETAKSIAVGNTGRYAPAAFEFEGQWHVLITPLSDYDWKNDVAQTWVRVDANGRTESLPGLALLLESMDHPGLYDAAKLAVEEL